MTIRDALGQIAVLPYIGNKAGSFRTAKEFENEVTSILRNVGGVMVERPLGSNNYPSFIHNGIDYQIKTAKGNKPMWNESYVRPNAVLILNLKFGTVIVHGSLIIDENKVGQLIDAKNHVANYMRDRFGTDGNFFISGARVQFGDKIEWEQSKISFLHNTIKIVEGLPDR